MMYSLLNETRNCQVCKKSFRNGRALGGHMRSHTRALSASNGSTVPSLKTPTKLGENIRLSETVLMRSVHKNKVGRPEPDLKRKESGQQITCNRKIVVELDECQSSLTAVEEAALCLVAMSKGERPANSQNWNAIDRLLSTPDDKEEYNRKSIDIDSDDDDDDNDGKYKFVASDGRVLTESIDENEDGDEDDEDETYLVEKEKQCKKKFTCDICGKVLHSYQALGGHRTSHRTKRLKICDRNGQAMVRHYKCELCSRVFESGQALGGHKKVHYMFL